MNARKNTAVLLIGFIFSVSLLSASVSSLLTAHFGSRAQFETLSAVCSQIIEEQPESKDAILSVLKNYQNDPGSAAGADLFSRYGYRPADFGSDTGRYLIFSSIGGFLLGFLLFLFTVLLDHRHKNRRIRELTGYLEATGNGRPDAVLRPEEDEFSGLEDEIGKTVGELYRTREQALKDKLRFADNLANIAHQLKTPIAAVSLSAQLMEEQEEPDGTAQAISGADAQKRTGYPAQIRRQLKGLTRLSEALLLLSRVDSGALPLAKEPVDVFTALSLAADSLEELSARAGVSIDVAELGEAIITADMEWTMEAFMNLMKNCVEHAPADSFVRCSYEQNPLCTLIRIHDEGEGFAPEDIPHLFERFYRGKNASPGGIGIGLSLAKDIIELQNGTVRADNLPDGGVCFEIRFYCH